jgi:hypothetical protein
MMVVIGPLLERGRCRLLVGVTAVYLPHGMMCELAIGTLVPRHVSGARGPSGNRDDPALAGVDDSPGGVSGLGILSYFPAPVRHH